jgi:hypothetical protein
VRVGRFQIGRWLDGLRDFSYRAACPAAAAARSGGRAGILALACGGTWAAGRQLTRFASIEVLAVAAPAGQQVLLEQRCIVGIAGGVGRSKDARKHDACAKGTRVPTSPESVSHRRHCYHAKRQQPCRMCNKGATRMARRTRTIGVRDLSHG